MIRDGGESVFFFSKFRLELIIRCSIRLSLPRRVQERCPFDNVFISVLIYIVCIQNLHT